MSDEMVTSKGKTNARSSSYRSKRRDIQESMLQYHERARHLNPRDSYVVDYLSRTTLEAPRIQPQFPHAYTQESLHRKKHRHPDIVSLKPLNSTMEQEHYRTKRPAEHQISLHRSNMQGMFCATSDNNGFGRRFNYHINAQVNRITALGPHQLTVQNLRNNILKQESDRLLMERFSDQYGEYRTQRRLLSVDPLDIYSSEHAVNRSERLVKSNQSTDVNDSSLLSADKDIQIDRDFRKKYNLLPVIDDTNNGEPQNINTKRSITTKSNDSTINNLHIDSLPDFPQRNAEFRYPDPASVPNRLLQRPQRAKRMGLNTPDLRVIPEAGAISVYPGHLELDREEMLLSKHLLIRNSHSYDVDRNGIMNRKKAASLKRQIVKDQQSVESTLDKSRLAMLYTLSDKE